MAYGMLTCYKLVELSEIKPIYLMCLGLDLQTLEQLSADIK